MNSNQPDFVNRTDERRVFTRFREHLSERILLLYGPKHMGKTALLREFRCAYDTEDAARLPGVLLDFRRRVKFADVEDVIDWFAERFGGTFARQLEQAEIELLLLSTVPLSEVLATPFRGSSDGSSEVMIKGSKVGENVVGRDLVNINISLNFPDPAGGTGYTWRKRERVRNIAFRETLVSMLRQHDVLLLFDHFDEAPHPVARWLIKHVLGGHEDGVKEFERLRIIVGSCTDQIIEEPERWQPLLRQLRLGPLSEDAIREFWVEHRGLDRNSLEQVIAQSAGNPGKLIELAAEAELARMTG